MDLAILLLDSNSGKASGEKARPYLKMAAILKISKYQR